MEANLVARRVASDLKHLPGRHGKCRTPRRVERIAIRNERAQGVVAAGEIHHDEIPGAALGQRRIAQELRRGKANGERRDSAPHEVAPGVLHTSWYSDDPMMRCSKPGAFTRSCASEPVHAAPVRR